MAGNDDDIWVKHGIKPGWAEWWRVMGIDSPEEARSWCERGFEHPATVRDWKAQKIEDPAEAEDWLRAGFSIPALASGWKDYGFHAECAKPWIESGVHSPSEANDWIDAEVDAEDAGLLRKLGFDPLRASQWVFSGHDEPYPELIREFSRRGITDPMVAEDWLAFASNYLPDSEAFEWVDLGFDLVTARRWRRARFNPSTARGWIDKGITSPEQAAQYRADEQRSRLIFLRAAWGHPCSAHSTRGTHLAMSIAFPRQQAQRQPAH